MPALPVDPEDTRTAAGSRRLTERFYRQLRREVWDGNPGLDDAGQALLRSHYPVMMAPERYPPPLVTTIYVERRAPAVAAVAGVEAPAVFDAGCGYGSESFLFAALGAEVLAVDLAPEQIAVARARRGYWEEVFGRRLEITFRAANLDGYDPELRHLSLTWLSSVLAAVPDQAGFLRRVHAATRPGGAVMITDMNLWNPLFLYKEWRRRRRAATRHPELRQRLDFAAMVRRRGRRGAIYHPGADGEGGSFDDAQFFTPGTLSRLLRECGFAPGRPAFSGFAPPMPEAPGLGALERLLARAPLLRRGGYFYRLTGRRGER